MSQGIFRTGPALAFVAIAGLFALPSMGTPTEPVLALSRVTSAVGASSRMVRIEGIFPGDDLVQIAYPLQILIRIGEQYVRYDVVQGAVGGSAPELADGLGSGEVAGLLGAGAPEANARVLFLGPDTIDVLLPAGFPSGAAEAQLFVLHGGTHPVLSNPLPLDIAVGAGS